MLVAVLRMTHQRPTLTGLRGNDYYVYICRRRGTSVAPRGLVLKASDGSKLEVVHEEEET